MARSRILKEQKHDDEGDRLMSDFEWITATLAGYVLGGIIVFVMTVLWFKYTDKHNRKGR